MKHVVSITAPLLTCLLALVPFALSAQTALPPAATKPARKIDKALTAEVMYEVLLGEIHARDQNPGVAYSLILDAAGKVQDEQLYQRATDLALLSRSGEAALQSARAWKQSFPLSRKANFYVLQILTALNRVDEIAAPLKLEIELSPEPERSATIAGLVRLSSPLSDKKSVASVYEQVLLPYTTQKATAVSAWSTLGRMRQAAGNSAGALQAAENGFEADKTALPPGLLALELVEQKVTKALPLLQRMITTVTQPELTLGLVQWQLQAKQYAEALVLLESLTTRQKNVPEAWLMLGLLHQEEQRTQAASNALTRYLTLAMAQPSPPVRGIAQAHLALAQLAEKNGDTPAAEVWLSKVEHPDFALQAQSRRASLLAKQGKLEQGMSLLQNMPVANAEQDKNRLLAQVRLLRDHMQWEPAHRLLSQAIQENPQDTDLVYELAMVDEKLNRLADMEMRLRDVMRRLPTQPQAFNALGYSLADRNIRLPEAKQLIEQAVALAPQDPFIADSLGWVEFRLGNILQARAILQKAYDMQPDAEIAAHLGEVLWQMQLPDEAKKLWRQGMQRDSDNPTLRETLLRLKVSL